MSYGELPTLRAGGLPSDQVACPGRKRERQPRAFSAVAVATWSAAATVLSSHGS